MGLVVMGHFAYAKNIMTKRNIQSGFGIVEVLVVIVVLAIGAGLGWVAYGKFVAKPAASTTTETKTTTVTTPTVKMLTGAFDTGFAVNVAWSYPEGWTPNKTGTAPASASDSASQKITLTSPSGAFQVTYDLNQNGGFGGTCDTQGPDKVRYVNRQSATNISTAAFIEAITDGINLTTDPYTTSGYLHISSLMGSDNANKVVVGDTACMVNSLERTLKIHTNPDVYLMQAQIAMKSIDTTNQDGMVQPVKDMATIKAQYDTAEYKDAVKILLSTQVK